MGLFLFGSLQIGNASKKALGLLPTLHVLKIKVNSKKLIPAQSHFLIIVAIQQSNVV